MAKKVVLAYSGGLDTSAIVPWLIENYGCEVVAFVADVGQGADELKGVEDKAIASGASECHVMDLRREFLESYVFPTLVAGITYEKKYLLGTSMARPVIAKAQVEIARKVGADALCHGCTGKGNDQVRFEHTFAALAPDLKVIAPWREWSMRSRDDLMDYIESKGVPCSASRQKPWSRDSNLWHVSHEGGVLENPWTPAPEEVWMRTSNPIDTPDEPEDVLIEFRNGRPVSLNGKAMDPVSLVDALNIIAGRHCVGRVDMIESRVVGMKSRGCYETPAGTVLVEALQALEQLTLDRDTRRFKEELGLRSAHLVYEGRWFTPVREILHAATEKIAERLNGEVVVRLHKCSAITIQRRAEKTLYSEAFATFGEDSVYNQKHAEGFIQIFSLPERIVALRDGVGGPNVEGKPLAPNEVMEQPTGVGTV